MNDADLGKRHQPTLTTVLAGQIEMLVRQRYARTPAPIVYSGHCNLCKEDHDPGDRPLADTATILEWLKRELEGHSHDGLVVSITIRKS